MIFVVFLLDILVDTVGENIADQHDIFDFAVFQIHLLEARHFIPDQFLDHLLVVFRLALDSGEALTDTKTTHTDILCRHKGVLIKQGNLKTAAVEVENRSSLSMTLLKLSSIAASACSQGNVAPS